MNAVTPAEPRRIAIGNLSIGNDRPLAVIAGPCALESRAHAQEMCQALVELTAKLGIGLIYKTSFDKANRTSIDGIRGLGMEKGLPILAELRERFGVPVLTDVHAPEQCVPTAEAVGLRFSGMSPDGVLPEIVELPEHPWFIGVQFHPELKSRPFEPHPLFASFIAAAKAQSRLV